MPFPAPSCKLVFLPDRTLHRTSAFSAVAQAAANPTSYSEPVGARIFILFALDDRESLVPFEPASTLRAVTALDLEEAERYD